MKKIFAAAVIITAMFAAQNANGQLQPLYYTPANGETGVYLSLLTAVTFNQNVLAGDLSAVSITPNPGNVYAVIFGNSLAIYHDNFTYNTEYTVHIPAGTIQGYNQEITWSFSTTNLEITNFNPANGQNDVSLYLWNEVYVEFDQYITALDLSGVTITPNSGNVTANINDNKLMIHHDNWLYDTEYTVHIPAGTIQGYNQEISWSFTTQCVPVTHWESHPQGGPWNTDIDVYAFYTASLPGGLQGDIVSLDLSGITITPNPGNVVASINGKRLEISHDNFDYNTTYTVHIPVGTIKCYEQETNYSFSTKDLTYSFFPGNGSNGVGTNADVGVQFGYDLNNVTALDLSGITIYPNPGNVYAEINDYQLKIYHNNFAYNTEYTVHIPAGAIQGYNQEINWSFRTENLTFNFYPEGGNVDRGANVYVEFNKNIIFDNPLLGSGDIVVLDLSGITITPNPGNISAHINDRKLEIHHDNFDYETFYTVHIPVGTIQNYNQEINWTFRTKDIPVNVSIDQISGITGTKAKIKGHTGGSHLTNIVELGLILKNQTTNHSDTIIITNFDMYEGFTYNASNLSFGTTYSVKAYCKIVGGTAYSGEAHFSTLTFNNNGTDCIIENVNDLLLLAQLVEAGNCFAGQKFILMNDIVLPNTPNNINSIGICEEVYDVEHGHSYFAQRPFCGEFDGNGKRIYNVYIDHPNTPFQGFFGCTNNANIHNFGLVNITASGRNYTGGMIAYAENTKITDCYVSGGTLFALSYCGGLVGYQTPGTNSIITGCYNTCTVTGNNYVGGLLGYSNQGTVRNSYAAALVTGNGNGVGAIIGGAQDVLNYNCYFNQESTGQTSAIGENNISKAIANRSGEGNMSSDEMRMQAFVNTLNQGLVIPVWKMDYNPPINNGFPILIWQTNVSSILPLQMEKTISIYPNPVVDKLEIRNQILENSKIEIFDIVGKLRLSTMSQHQNSIDVSALPSGVYVVKIGNCIGKFVKQ